MKAAVKALMGDEAEAEDRWAGPQGGTGTSAWYLAVACRRRRRTRGSRPTATTGCRVRTRARARRRAPAQARAVQVAAASLEHPSRRPNADRRVGTGPLLQVGTLTTQGQILAAEGGGRRGGRRLGICRRLYPTRAGKGGQTVELVTRTWTSGPVVRPGGVGCRGPMRRAG